MLNIGAMLAILTTITLNDYYTDQIQENRQKLHSYAEAMERIGDNVRIWGYTITSTLKKSGRTDLEQSILLGAQELPLYLFSQVIRSQHSDPTKYQKRIIDIAFQNLNMVSFSRIEYDQTLRMDNLALQCMEETVDLSPTRCGAFWHQFLEVMDGATAGEDVVENILDAYAQLLCDFTILGDGNVQNAQRLYERFVGGLQRALQEYSENVVLFEDPQQQSALDAMRENCRTVRSLTSDEEDILLDFFDYFVVAIYVGMLQKLSLEASERIRMLQFLLDHTSVVYPDDAPQIYANIDTDANAYLAYYGLANDWNGPNFWAIHLIGATKAGRDDLSAEFVDRAGDFLRGTERLLRRNFPEYDFDGLAQVYHTEVIRKMMEMVGEKGNFRKHDI